MKKGVYHVNLIYMHLVVLFISIHQYDLHTIVTIFTVKSINEFHSISVNIKAVFNVDHLAQF